MAHTFTVSRAVFNLRVKSTLRDHGIKHTATTEGNLVTVTTEGTTSYQCTAINRAIDGIR
jgi:hypothetical protein